MSTDQEQDQFNWVASGPRSAIAMHEWLMAEQAHHSWQTIEAWREQNAALFAQMDRLRAKTADDTLRYQDQVREWTTAIAWWRDSAAALERVTGAQRDEIDGLIAGTDAAPVVEGAHLTPGQLIHWFNGLGGRERLDAAARFLNYSAEAEACYARDHVSQLENLEQQVITQRAEIERLSGQAKRRDQSDRLSALLPAEPAAQHRASTHDVDDEDRAFVRGLAVQYGDAAVGEALRNVAEETGQRRYPPLVEFSEDDVQPTEADR